MVRLLARFILPLDQQSTQDTATIHVSLLVRDSPQANLALGVLFPTWHRVVLLFLEVSQASILSLSASSDIALASCFRRGAGDRVKVYLRDPSGTREMARGRAHAAFPVVQSSISCSA